MTDPVPTAPVKAISGAFAIKVTDTVLERQWLILVQGPDVDHCLELAAVLIQCCDDGSATAAEQEICRCRSKTITFRRHATRVLDDEPGLGMRCPGATKAAAITATALERGDMPGVVRPIQPVAQGLAVT